MVKNIFGKLKKGREIDDNDDRQTLEGKMVLERLASIMTSIESNRKNNQVDIKEAPDTPLSDSIIVIDKSETGGRETFSKLETHEDNLSAVQNVGTEFLPSKIEGAIASYGNEIRVMKPQDKSESYNRETISEENITALSATIENKESPVILVVEDEPVTQKLIKKILEDRGYGVVIAGDGIDALMELGKGDFDLILSDLSMPNLDGFKLLDFINVKGIKVPIIFLTISVDVEDEIKVLALGAKDYIRKPINRDLLLLRVSKVLNQNR